MKGGYPATEFQDDTFDEVVIFEAQQAMPCFIVQSLAQEIQSLQFALSNANDRVVRRFLQAKLTELIEKYRNSHP